MSRPGKKIEFQAIDDLFGLTSTEGEPEKKIELSKIKSFHEHPFKVIHNEEMDELINSIKENGLITPVLVRPVDSDYEMVSGHRRLYACKQLGLTEIDAIVKTLTDEEATIAMVDANMQREEILPSERAFALKLKLDAYKKLGRVNHGDEKKYHETERLAVIGATSNLSREQVRRYIRLTELIPELLEMVDTKTLTIKSAIPISYLDEAGQKIILDVYTKGKRLNEAQAEYVKELYNNNNLTKEKVLELFIKKKTNNGFSKKFSKEISSYFPPEYTTKDIEEILLSLAEKWKSESNK